jgi:hypothetical protein
MLAALFQTTTFLAAAVSGSSLALVLEFDCVLLRSSMWSYAQTSFTAMPVDPDTVTHDIRAVTVSDRMAQHGFTYRRWLGGKQSLRLVFGSRIRLCTFVDVVVCPNIVHCYAR